MQKVLILLLVLFMTVSFIFFVFSHAPSKRNKNKKKITIRKWSTISLIVTSMISCLLVSKPAIAVCIAISFVLLDMACNIIIDNL